MIVLILERCKVRVEEEVVEVTHNEKENFSRQTGLVSHFRMALKYPAIL